LRRRSVSLDTPHSAIGIAGMDRLVRFNVVAMSGRAVEAAGDVDTLLLDKTGTITLGNRQAKFKPLRGVSERELADAAQLALSTDIRAFIAANEAQLKTKD
jgi:K+-transporting ATPase ATPase B chain